MTHGLNEICDMLMNLALKVKSDCEDSRYIHVKDYVCTYLTYQFTCS